MTITINGSGSITGLSAGGLPDATIQQADLATGVAGTGPAFSAYQSSAQTLSSATFTKIQCQTEQFDTNSNFNNTASTVGGIPAYAFLPSVAGYYQVSGGCSVASSQTAIYLYFYKNGALEKNAGGVGGTVGVASGSALVYCNGTTDYIELYCLFGTGQNTNAGIAFTYFQGLLVRAA